MTVRLISDRNEVEPSAKKRLTHSQLSLVPKTRPVQEPSWTLEAHVCRCCFGRLVSREVAPGVGLVSQSPGREYLCSNCGARAESQSPDSICSCGIKIRKRNASGRSGGVMIDAGIRCMPNPTPTPEFPSLIVASEVPVAPSAKLA